MIYFRETSTVTVADPETGHGKAKEHEIYILFLQGQKSCMWVDFNLRT